MADNKHMTERALGAVLGSAAGDALGARFEFQGAGEYGKAFPVPVLGGIGEQTGGGGLAWKPGEFTDDTQMAIVQADSLIKCRGIDGADLFERFKEWAQDAKDVGISTRSVLNSKATWETAATDYYKEHPTGSAGNGGLMRATPSAVYFSQRSLEESMDAARALAAVTHGDPAAQWGAAIYHGMLHAALQGNDAFAALEKIVASLPDDQQRFVEMLDPAWCPDDNSLGNGSVWGCLAQAVWAVRTTHTFHDALVAAIQLGDDADTVAAVTGGIAGAIYGIQAIPSRWTTYLNGEVPGRNGPVRNSDLQRLTVELLGNKPHEEQPPGTPEGPTEIARGLYAADLGAAAKVPTDWAVISLCRVGNKFADHPVRREVYMVDSSDDHNAALGDAVLDVVDSIDAFLSEGRKVVVHCHGGASRTGLALRAWIMRNDGCSEAEATKQVGEIWPALGLWNDSFTDFLRNDWLN